MDQHYTSQQDRSELAEEVRFFREHSTKLKQMFKETVTVLSDLQSFNESLSLDIILDVQAQRCVGGGGAGMWGWGWGWGRDAWVGVGQGCVGVSPVTCAHLECCQGQLDTYVTTERIDVEHKGEINHCLRGNCVGVIVWLSLVEAPVSSTQLRQQSSHRHSMTSHTLRVYAYQLRKNHPCVTE